jgi:hypothetical protein
VLDTTSIVFYQHPTTKRYRAKVNFSRAIGRIFVCRYSAGNVDSLPIPTGFPATTNCGQRTTPSIIGNTTGFVDFELNPQPGNRTNPCGPCGNLWYTVKRTTTRGDIYSNNLYIRRP